MGKILFRHGPFWLLRLLLAHVTPLNLSATTHNKIFIIVHQKVKNSEIQLTIAHSWRQVILGTNTLCIQAFFAVSSAIWFIKINITPDVACIMCTVYRLAKVTKRHLLCQFAAERSRDVGTTRGISWVHILGRLCHSRQIILIIQVLWLSFGHALPIVALNLPLV